MVAERLADLLPKNLPVVIGDLPASSNEVIGIVEYDGSQSTEYFGAKESSSILNPIVKFVIRSITYPTGSDWADQIKDILHRYHDDYFVSILLVSSPIYLGRSPEKLHEFQVTFRIQVKE